MKLFIYSAVLLSLFAACRHQKAVTSNTPPPAPEVSATPTYTMTTTQGDVQIVTDESVTATITIDNPPDDTVVTTVVAAPAVDSGQAIYRLTVSFISKGEGIDYKTKESFENWLKDQPKRPSYEVTHWGREGETNYCLKLNELSTREQEIFVRDVRTQLTDKPLVFVSEYAACKGTK